MSRYVPSLDASDPTISQEADTIIREASEPLKRWMEDSIDKLHKDFTARIEEAAETLKKEASTISEDYEKLGSSLSVLINELSQIQLKLPAGTDPQLLAASKKVADEMKQYLQQREEKWKSAGANTVKALMTAKTALTGIP